MAKDQKVTLTFTLADGSTQDVSFVVPAGKDGSGGSGSTTRETTMLRFNLNTPDAAEPNASGRISGGMYVRKRDYLPSDIKDTNVIVEYSLLDIPLYGANSSCYSLDVTPPMVDASNGRVYCDVQLTAYYTFTYVREIGSNTNRRIYRTPGTAGTGTLIPVSTKAEDVDVLRFYRSIIR